MAEEIIIIIIVTIVVEMDKDLLRIQSFLHENSENSYRTIKKMIHIGIDEDETMKLPKGKLHDDFESRKKKLKNKLKLSTNTQIT